jgi:hypothetical protein
MAGVEVGNFGSPDETRTPDKTTADVVRIGGASAARMRLEPGWKWSECIKPIVGGERCQANHVGLLQSGTMRVVHDDGTEQETRAGQAYVIEPVTTRGSSATSPSSGSSSSREQPRSTRRADPLLHRPVMTARPLYERSSTLSTEPATQPGGERVRQTFFRRPSR